MIIERELKILQNIIDNNKGKIEFSEDNIRILIKKSDGIKKSLRIIVSECCIDKTINKDIYSDVLDKIDSNIIKNLLKEYIKENEYIIKDVFNENIEELSESDDEEELKENNLLELEDINKNGIRICKNVTNARDMYIKEISYIPRLSEEETKKLFKEYSETCDPNRKKEIENELVEHNMKLVFSLAKRYISAASLEDLLSEGSLGLKKAIQKFDLSKGFKLSTYATWWINQSITRYLEDNDRTIRIPSNLLQKMKRIDYVTKEYYRENDGKKPSTEELMELTGLSLTDIENCNKYELKKVSINKQVGEDGESDGDELGDFIADSNSEKEIYDNTYKNELVTKVDELLDHVFPIDINSSRKKEENVRYRFVLKHRFGLNGEQQKTLKELSLLLNVTTERVRQIEAKALRKLRQNNNTKSLKLFLDE